MSDEVILLIPALDPDQHLLDFLDELMKRWQGPVVLVDDGSGEAAVNDIFPAAKAMAGNACVVVRHACNLGKGRALKTGFNEVLNRWPGAAGVITADADGQHRPEDIIKCADRLRKNPDALTLGCRDFHEENVPFKSRAGNRITRCFMRFLCGVNVSDTQTGLRAIPTAFMKSLMNVSGERFDFETNMLLEARTESVAIEEQTIDTVYIEQNRASHFNPLTDSIRIYSLLLKFCSSSFIGFIADIVLFTLFIRAFSVLGLGAWLITACTVAARVLSAGINFTLNRTMVFRSRQNAGTSAVKYAILCILQMAASAALVTSAAGVFTVSTVVLKVIVDFVLFLISFQIQRSIVFKN